ncbi:TetR/AcrR family transcriptional regulator [Microbacterium nanhaiense]|uniref:TetR/AcrR family transcriptional regulator n=1 Tax=Microbacterium nanhaiense TaxID=1301026 RepID=UPI00166D9B9E|nr:TetR/AcrR family transcriptional regulator [Microbacterium nanhaiense]
MSIISTTTSDDPRAVRSRERMQEALMRMLAREELSSIGVAELCREAGIHRTTFYGHYESVGELAADTFAAIIKAAATARPRRGDSVEQISRAYLAAAENVLAAVARDRRAIRCLLDSSLSLDFRGRLRDHFLTHAASAIDAMRDHNPELPENTEVGAAFVAGGIVSVIELWAHSDSDDAAAFAARLYRSMPSWWPIPQQTTV